LRIQSVAVCQFCVTRVGKRQSLRGCRATERHSERERDREKEIKREREQEQESERAREQESKGAREQEGKRATDGGSQTNLAHDLRQG